MKKPFLYLTVSFCRSQMEGSRLKSARAAEPVKKSNAGLFLARSSQPEFSTSAPEANVRVRAKSQPNGSTDWACVQKMKVGGASSSDAHRAPVGCWETDPAAKPSNNKNGYFGSGLSQANGSLSSTRDPADKTRFVSCPSLAKEESKAARAIKQKAAICYSYDERRINQTRLCDKSSVRKPLVDQLVVPDIFTTSLSRSAKSLNESGVANGDSAAGSKLNGKLNAAIFRSAPQLTANGFDERQRGAPARGVKPAAVPAPPAGDTPATPQLCRVLSYLYLDTCRGLSNARSLCRMKIGSVVDISIRTAPSGAGASTPAPDENINTDIPCLCSNGAGHRPAVMRLSFTRADSRQIPLYFAQINKFVDGARRFDKNVLVRSNGDRDLGLLVVLQYLIGGRKMSLREAYSLVMKQQSDITLNAVYRRVLQDIDERTHTADDQSCDTALRQSSAPAGLTDLLPREAWSKC